VASVNVGRNDDADAEMVVLGFVDGGSRSVGNFEGDAALAGSRIESGVDVLVVDALEDAFHDGEVHAAYEFLVFGCERVEGAVADADGSVVVVGLVPALGEYLLEAGGDPGCFMRIVTASGRLCPYFRSEFSGTLVEGGSPGRLVGVEGVGEQAGGGLVVAWRHADMERAGGASVELGGPA
jgi:hypothetical protein